MRIFFSLFLKNSVTVRQQYRRVIDDDNDATENADDDDIAATIIRVSLQCPLVKFRIQYPAKGVNCTHLQCFDGSAYISLNEKKPMWVCPVCSKALYYDDLALDQLVSFEYSHFAKNFVSFISFSTVCRYFMDVLRSDQLADDCQEVQLFVDGTWKSFDEEKASENNDGGKNQSNSPSSSPGPSVMIFLQLSQAYDYKLPHRYSNRIFLLFRLQLSLLQIRLMILVSRKKTKSC